ncbi:MAG: AraC family transcriptional regulator [Gammaproteobacteria bacterium]|nr:MAG: AraC family transcriptional regulator [Gammaproteobacteria bacterium]
MNIEVLKFWFIFSFSLGCWTCVNLIVSRRGDKRVKYTLLSLIFLLLAPPFNAYVNLVSDESVRWLTVASQKLTWAYGPVMVAIIQHILLKPISRLSYSIQALPLLLVSIHDILNLQWLGDRVIIFLLFTHVFSYLACAAWLLKSERSRVLKITTRFKNTSYYWLIFVVAGLFLVMLTDLTIVTSVMLGHLPSLTALAIIGSVIAVLIDCIALFSIYQPEIFVHEIDQQEEHTTAEKPQLRSIELSPEAARQLDEQLDALIETHKPYLDEDISLPKLASLLGVTSHQLSELLNIHKSTNFYDFLNGLRYQESLRLLLNNDDELTIADIAYRSGFNNRNSFYKVFKEKTGVTPTQYKRNNV